MKLNDQTKAIAGAAGWLAVFSSGQKRRPLLCWALVGSDLIGIIQDPKNKQAGSAEDEKGFEGYSYEPFEKPFSWARER